MTLRHYAFSRQHWTKFSEDVYAFVLWRYVAVQIWRVKELFVPGIVASTIKEVSHLVCHRMSTPKNLEKPRQVCVFYFVQFETRMSKTSIL